MGGASLMRRRRRGRSVASIEDRYRQVFDAMEVVLEPFTAAELACVTLDPEFPYPLPNGDSAADGPVGWPAMAPEVEWIDPGAVSDSGDPAASIATLERRGYLRPGVPAGQGGRIPIELAGLAAAPGHVGERLRVAIAGDLGIVTRMRIQPAMLVEVCTAVGPVDRDWVATEWRQAASAYLTTVPPVVLVERPAAPGGRLSPMVLLGQERFLLALMTWCGADIEELRLAQGQNLGKLHPLAPINDVAGEFANRTRIRVAAPCGQRAVVISLVLASCRGRHWILQGDSNERAAQVSIDQLSERIAALPGQIAEAAHSVSAQARSRERAGR